MAWLHDPMRIILGVVIIAQIIMAVRLIKLRDFIEEVNIRTKGWKSPAVEPPPPEPDPTPPSTQLVPSYLLMKQSMQERENSPRRICPANNSICFAPECMTAGCQEALDPTGAPSPLATKVTRRIDESIQSTCRLAEMGQPLRSCEVCHGDESLCRTDCEHRESDAYRVHRILEVSLTDAFGTMGINVLPGQRNWLASHIIKSLEAHGFGVGEYE